MAILYIKNRFNLGLLLLIPILVWFVNYNANDNDFSFCLIKNIFGIKCYGCGLIRGISALLHLKFHRIYELNKINLISIPILIYLYLSSIIELFKKITLRRILYFSYVLRQNNLD